MLFPVASPPKQYLRPSLSPSFRICFFILVDRLLQKLVPYVPSEFKRRETLITQMFLPVQGRKRKCSAEEQMLRTVIDLRLLGHLNKSRKSIHLDDFKILK